MLLDVKTADCIATESPPNPSENADKTSAAKFIFDGKSEKDFTAFVTSEIAENIYVNGTYFTCFFINPFITEKSEINEIIPIELTPAPLTELIKL